MGKQGRDEAPEGLAVEDRECQLPGLVRDQASPGRVPLGPELLTLVLDALAEPVDHDSERHRVDPGDDPSLEARRACVARDRVEAAWIATLGCPHLEELRQHLPVVGRRPTDEEVVHRIPQVPAQPLQVGLEAAGGDHDRRRLDLLVAVGRDHPGRLKDAVANAQGHDLRLEADLHP
jgi:hypothetical protein